MKYVNDSQKKSCYLLKHSGRLTFK